MRALLALPVAAALGVAALVSCGGEDPFCGDRHVDPGEQCDDGDTDDTDACLSNCRIRIVPSLVLKWAFNASEELGFSGDGCTDMGSRTVEVTISGAGGTFMASDSCTLRQVVFEDIAAGTYQVSVRVLDRDGALLTDSAIEASVDFTGAAAEQHEVVVGPERWNDSYDGTFFFRLSWAGADCDAATPAVIEHVLTLTQGGIPVTQVTQAGDPLDGSAPGTCQSVSEQFPQSALTVPFGVSEFTVEGRDQFGMVQFRQTFATFVGAGVSNPELLFDVASLAPMGADAGPIDGG